MFDISQQEVNFACPDCKAENTITLKQAQNEETIKCAGCEKDIKLTDEDGSVDKSVRDINRAGKDIEDAVNKFGK